MPCQCSKVRFAKMMPLSRAEGSRGADRSSIPESEATRPAPGHPLSYSMALASRLPMRAWTGFTSLFQLLHMQFNRLPYQSENFLPALSVAIHPGRSGREPRSLPRLSHDDHIFHIFPPPRSGRPVLKCSPTSPAGYQHSPCPIAMAPGLLRTPGRAR